MDIPINAEVDCTDGPCGQTTYIILNPDTEQVTHLVVKDQAYSQHLVPVEMITESSPRRVQLHCSKEELSKLPPFLQSEYVPVGLSYPAYMLWPEAMMNTAAVNLVHKQIPPGEVAIDRGARVEARNGHIGRVDELLIDSLTGQVTHLVLREGHLWGQREITIPVTQIDRIKDDTIFLKMTKEEIEKLPKQQIR